MKLIILFFTTSLFFMSASYSQYDPDYNLDDDEDIRALSFKDRLYTGGNFGARFGTITSVELSPLVGYRITKEYSAGIGLKYSYFRDKRPPVFSTSTYGGSVFTRYLFFDKLIAHAELEMLNIELYKSFSTSRREWVPIGLVGGGYTSNGFQIMLLYDLIGDERNPYVGLFGNDSRLYLRVGFLFNL